MTIQPYTHNLKPQFSQLLVDYFTEIQAGIPEDIIRGKLADLMETSCNTHTLQVDLVFYGSNAIGFSIYQIDTSESDWCKRPGWGFVREFYIDPGYRSQGFGQALAEHTERKLWSMGAARLYLTADTEIPFWLRCGWLKTHTLASNGLTILEK